MDPLTLVVPAKELIGNLLERYWRTQDKKIDTNAVLRLLVIEARRNLAVLDVAVARKAALPAGALWNVPMVLRIEVLEALLSRDVRSDKALKTIAGFTSKRQADGSDEPGTASLAMSLYVRTTALQALCTLNRKSGLDRVQIKLRLERLREDFIHFTRALGTITQSQDR